METKFNFKSQICTSREQSEKLIALGLKKETADMEIWFDPNQMIESRQISVIPKGYFLDYYKESLISEGSIFTPAWSLHRLIEMCDIVIRVFKNRVSLSSGHSFSAEETLYDNLIDCIEWLIKQGYFNKEYLNGITND